MASIPRVTLDDSYTLGITCAICGADALKVNHIPNLPDYVSCADCSSAFLVEEGGDRVFFGQIAPGFANTEHFALKQWAWLEAIETRAREERAAPPEIPMNFPSDEFATTADADETLISPKPGIESVSAEEWISTEIPRADLLKKTEDADITELSDFEGQLEPDEPEAQIAEIPAAADEKPFSFRPFDLEAEEAAEKPDVEEAGEQGLEDFFAALTDDMGDADPDSLFSTEDTPIETGLDADLARLLNTEEDTGPELAPPPWAAKSTPEVASPVENIDSEDLPSWEDLQEQKPLTDPGAEPEIPAWSLPAEGTESDDLPSWDDFEEDETPEKADDSPQAPSWALPTEDEPLEPAAEAAGTGSLPWDADRFEQKNQSWQEIPQASSEESADDGDDFLAGLRRSASVPLESQPVVDEPISEFDEDDLDSAWDVSSDDLSARIESVSQPFGAPEKVAAGWEMTAAGAVAESTPEPELEIPEPVLPIEPDTYFPPATDPPPGQRYRVVIRGESVVFPYGECAHCGNTPTKGKLAVSGTLPRGQTVGQRRPTRFEVPLCAECRKRAATKSEDAKAAQIQAHLISAIVSMVLVVAALAFKIINPRDLGIADLFLGLILIIVGYGGPAFFLLNRVGNFRPPVDARYIRTTLLVPRETQGLETAFEWRNSEYAQRFHEANQSNTLGNVSSLKDRIT